MERKYLEYFDGAFDSTVADKIKPQNKPYVAYSKTEGVVFTVIPEEPTSAYQMVDLGLSVKWADRNVGAETPQDNGLYFSWGNVDGHAVDENGNTVDGYSFDLDMYSTTLGGQYTGSTLDAEHDAATVNMGEEWRMPTSYEIHELVTNTDHYYISEDGNIVGGPFNYETSFSDKGLDGSKLHSICFIKKNVIFNYSDRSNFIEFPFADHCAGSLVDAVGLDGCIWANSQQSSSAKRAYFLDFGSEGRLYGGNVSYVDQYYGLSVRGVQPQPTNNFKGHSPS